MARDTEALEARAQEVLAGKYVQWQFSDGHEFRIPSWHFAYERAVYYAENDEDRDGVPFMETFETELKAANEDSYNIIDWARNNYNWEDVKQWAELVAQHPADSPYDEEWGNDLEVLEQDASGKWKEV